MQSIAFGDIRLNVQCDAQDSVVDGASGDPWAQVNSSSAATITYGDSPEDLGDLWVESGVVTASAFRWCCRDDTLDPLRPVRDLAYPIDQRAATRDQPTREGPEPPGTLLATADEEAMAIPPPLVETLVCLECEGLNPPMTARCRSCAALLSGRNSELRSVSQPALGVIHLSDDRTEMLNTDLLIGRNPTRFGVRPRQRAVVLGIGDQSVSRLHLELALHGRTVRVTSFKKGGDTTAETRLGGRVKIDSGVPYPLSDGDTVFLGRAWFRYEERSWSAAANPIPP